MTVLISPDDAYYVANGDWNDDYLYAGQIPGRDNILAATILTFGVASAVPPGAEIDSATLRLYSVDGDDELGAFRIEGTLPSDTYDPGFDDYLAGPLDTASSTGGWTTWDVTAAVRAWVAGTEANDGLAIFDRDGWGAFDDASAGATAPQLVVQYHSPNADPPQLWGHGPQAGAIRYDDVDGDGTADLVGMNSSSRALMVALSTDTAFATATGWGTWPSGYDAQFADVDGDGLADVVGRSSTGDVRVGISTGSAFEASTSWGTTAANDDVRLADVDGDGADDLVAYRPSDGVVRVAASTMEGFYPLEAWGTVGAGQRRLADADGDGNVDLWIRNMSTGDVLVRRSNAEGFTAPSYWGNWQTSRDFDATDADGDSRGDAVGWNPATRDIFVGLTTVEIPEGPPVEAFPEDPEVDYDDEDIVAPDGLARAPLRNRMPRLAFEDGALNNPDMLGASQTQALYDRIDEAGATVVRFKLVWGQIEDQNGRFIWDILAERNPPQVWAMDRAVDAARARGMHVHLTLTGVNASCDCASHILPNGLGCPPNPPTGADPDPDQYAEFVAAVVEHFTQPTVRVTSYSLWNEPNGRGFLGRRGANNKLMPTALYRELYLKGYDAATGVYPDAGVLVLGASAGDSGAAARSCRAHEGRIVAISPVSRITAVRAAGTRAWSACLDRSGRGRRLGLQDPPEEEVRRPRLAGSYVAFEHRRNGAGLPGPTAKVLDLASDRRASMTVDGGVTGLVLSRRGDLVAAGPDSVQHVRHGRAIARLDEGEIAPGSLALSPNGRYVYWLSGGRARSFVLPAGRAARLAASRTKHSCLRNRPGWIVAITPRSRITEVRVAGSWAWVACLDRGGRRPLLGVQDSPEEEVARPRLAGTYVAYELSEMSVAPGPEAIVFDLASRRRASLTLEGGITELVLSRRGDLIATSPSAVRHARPVGRGRIEATLDEGDIVRGSLALSPNGRHAYWLNGGQPRSFFVPR